MFQVDANHVTGLRDVPHAFVPMVFFHVARMLLQQTVNCIVCMNGYERLRRANVVNDNVLALASGRSLRSVDVETALMHNRIPVDGINNLDFFPFVVVNDNIVLKVFFYLGQEVCVDDGNFLGIFRIFSWNSKWSMISFISSSMSAGVVPASGVTVETALPVSEGVGRSARVEVDHHCGDRAGTKAPTTG
jgi:hypothetical protein